MGWRDIIGPDSDSSSKWPGETARSTCRRRISSACGSMPRRVTDSGSLSVLPAVPARRLRAQFRSRHHDHRRRERHRASRRCWKGSRCSPATTRPAAARATCRSIIPRRSRRWAAACRRRCARAGCRRSRTDGSSAPKASSRSRAISIGRRWKPIDNSAGLPFAFARRGLPAIFRGAMPVAGHLHLR